MAGSSTPHLRDPVRGAAGPVAGIGAATTARLGNGMEVVVVPDLRSPVVTHMVWYRNGSADDPPGQSGIAHFLEHLMFKGTEAYPAEHFAASLAGVGGHENAFTGWNFTSYYQRVPGEHLAACMAYEADRMRGLLLDDADVVCERDVVLAERGMLCDADPAARLDEAVAAAAFPAHPSGRPIIGWRHEIEGLGRAEALAYYRRFYRPENAILIVAGNAQPSAVLAMAEAAYGPIPAEGGVPERTRVQDPPASMRAPITLADPAVRQPCLIRLHPVPSYRTAVDGEAEALEVLSVLLGRGPTALLHARLVRERACATSVSVDYLGLDFGGMARLTIRAVPSADFGPEELDGAVEEVFRDLAGTGFSAADVARAKRILVADTLYERDSQVSLAQWYGMSLVCGRGIEDLAAWQLRIEAVTPEALLGVLPRLDRRAGVSGYLLEAAAAA